MQQGNAMNCGHMGLMGDFGGSFQDLPRLSRLLGPKNKQLQHETLWEGLTNSFRKCKGFF